MDAAQDQKSYLKAVSTLMLEGWTMMGKTCPLAGCGHCSLFRDRSRKIIQCVKCSRRFVTEEDASKMPQSPPTMTEHSSEVADKRKLEPEERNSAAMVGSSRSVCAQEIRNRATANMGERLLQGWAMLAETCPKKQCQGMPLLRSAAISLYGSSNSSSKSSPGNSGIHCLSCELFDAQEKLKSTPSAALFPFENMPQSLAPKRPQPTTQVKQESQDRRRQGRQDASSRIGEKLLAGWRMLATFCPSSECEGVPLMSSPANPETHICVSCDIEFSPSVKEDNGNRAQTTSSTKIPEQRECEPESSSSEDEDAQLSEDAEYMEAEVRYRESRFGRGSNKLIPPDATTGKFLPTLSDESTIALHEAKDRALRVIAAKISTAADLLDASNENSSGSFEGDLAICTLIEALARTAKALGEH